MKRRAFTLVELVVVLAIIAVVTHLAVRELAHLRDGRLSDAADRQLDEIRLSIFDDSAEGAARGFLADMGRMPSAADGTLSELLLMPTGALRYAVRQATKENLVPGAKHLANASVYVPTGWKGPYLRLPFGADRLRDPWGNPIEAEDDAGLPRVFTTNGIVTALAHYGPSARAEGEHKLQIFQEDRGPGSRLVVSLESTSTDLGGKTVTLVWYGPVDGLITGAVESAVHPAPVVVEGLPPGRRVLVCSTADNSVNVMRTVDVEPGDNQFVIKIP